MPSTPSRHLPTAVLLQEQTDIGRSIIKALENTKYFDVTHVIQDEAEFDRLLASGTVLFAIEIPQISSAPYGAAIVPRCWWRPTPPIRSPRVRRWRRSAPWWKPRLHMTAPSRMGQRRRSRFSHVRYNPAANSSLNIVPGLVGTILTMTMLVFTAMSVTREIERGTMESLLSMPITPLEIMLGKIIPYIVVGFVRRL